MRSATATGGRRSARRTDGGPRPSRPPRCVARSAPPGSTSSGVDVTEVIEPGDDDIGGPAEAYDADYPDTGVAGIPTPTTKVDPRHARRTDPRGGPSRTWILYDEPDDHTPSDGPLYPVAAEEAISIVTDDEDAAHHRRGRAHRHRRGMRSPTPSNRPGPPPSRIPPMTYRHRLRGRAYPASRHGDERRRGRTGPVSPTPSRPTRGPPPWFTLARPTTACPGQFR